MDNIFDLYGIPRPFGDEYFHFLYLIKGAESKREIDVLLEKAARAKDIDGREMSKLADIGLERRCNLKRYY